MYGTDWRYRRLPWPGDRFDAQHQLYGLVLPQFYLEVGYNDLTVKMGHYAAMMGYEVVGGRATFLFPFLRHELFRDHSDHRHGGRL